MSVNNSSRHQRHFRADEAVAETNGDRLAEPAGNGDALRFDDYARRDCPWPHVIPEGTRRRSLEDCFEGFVAHGFNQRILGFGVEAARVYGEVMGSRKMLGRPISILDGQIAAIARVNHFAVATRNVDDFEECGVTLINPFRESKGQ